MSPLRRRLCALGMLGFLAASALVAIFTAPAHACVGMTVTIGYVDAPEHEMAARILSTLILERTGTSTELKAADDLDDLDAKLASGDVGIALLPIGHAVERIAAAGTPVEGDERSFVRTRDNLDRGLVWLDALGFDAPSSSGWLADGEPSPVSPVMRKELIEDFPAMPRLIQKLAARVSPEALARTVAEVEAGERPKKVTRSFLEGERLI